MAHLLMVESWILSSGILLPQIIRQLGHSYTLICRDPQHYDNFLNNQPHPAAALADEIVTVETNDVDTLLQKVTELHQHRRFAGVISCCDYYLGSVAKIAETLGLPTASSASIKVANNKAMMREAMARAGLPGPKFSCVSKLEDAISAASEIGYPLIIKPTDLCGSLLVKRVRDQVELEEAFLEIQNSPLNARQQNREKKILLEEFLEGEEFSVESYSCQGVTGFFGVTDKSLYGESNFVESGHMFPAAIDSGQENALIKCVRDALIAVGYDHGLAHTEVKWTSQGPRIVEINTRAGGNWISELIRHVKGVNPLEYSVRLALGETLAQNFSGKGDAQNAAIQFLVPNREGTLKAVHGWDTIQKNQYVLGSLLHPSISGKAVTKARDNDAYLGYVMCRDYNGSNARTLAANIIQKIDLEYESEPDLKLNLAAALEHN